VKGEKPSRVQQIIGGLGRSPGSGAGAGFDGVVVFDEAHAMANAAGDKANAARRNPRNRARPDNATTTNSARCCYAIRQGSGVSNSRSSGPLALRIKQEKHGRGSMR
jgi:hypothetical protein